MATSKPNKKPLSITQRKKVISAMNKLLKDHNLSDFKVFEIKLEPKSINTFTNCEDLVCNPGEKKIEVHKPDGTVECICVPK